MSEQDSFEPDVADEDLPTNWYVNSGYQTTVRLVSRTSSMHIILQEWDEETYCVTPMVPPSVSEASSENDQASTETFSNQSNATNYAVDLAYDLAE